LSGKDNYSTIRKLVFYRTSLRKLKTLTNASPTFIFGFSKFTVTLQWNLTDI